MTSMNSKIYENLNFWKDFNIFAPDDNARINLKKSISTSNKGENYKKYPILAFFPFNSAFIEV